MNAFKSFVAISAFVLSAPAMAALNGTVDCAQMPAHPDCIEMPRMTVDVLQVQVSPEDYERLKALKSAYGKAFFAEVLKSATNPSLNWQKEQERIRLEQLFKTFTKQADAGEIQKLIQTLENVKVAVETQDMLDQRFGNGLGGVKLSFLKTK